MTPPQHPGDIDAGVDIRGPFEARDGMVYDLRAFARHFILLGVAGARVRVRRKADGAIGAMSFTSSPLTFRDFRVDRGGPRA